jgi:hypothetical protein
MMICVHFALVYSACAKMSGPDLAEKARIFAPRECVNSAANMRASGTVPRVPRG